MIRIILDPQAARQLQKMDMNEPVELCDSTGRLLARVMPMVDISQCDAVSPGISEEELSRRSTSGEQRFTTKELLERLGQL